LFNAVLASCVFVCVCVCLPLLLTSYIWSEFATSAMFGCEKLVRVKTGAATCAILCRASC